MVSSTWHGSYLYSGIACKHYSTRKQISDFPELIPNHKSIHQQPPLACTHIICTHRYTQENICTQLCILKMHTLTHTPARRHTQWPHTRTYLYWVLHQRVYMASMLTSHSKMQVSVPSIIIHRSAWRVKGVDSVDKRSYFIAQMTFLWRVTYVKTPFGRVGLPTSYYGLINP